MSAKGVAKKSQWLTCSRCNTKVYDTVITRHMWKSHRAYMMKNRGGRKAASPSTGKPVDIGLHAAREAEQKAKKLRSGVAKVPPMPKKYLSDIELAFMAGSDKPTAEETRLRATYLAREGKTLTITVHQGKNYVEISNVTLVEISE
jgi:hypothetical protein